MGTQQDNDATLVHQTVRLPKGLLRRMKVWAALHDTTQQQLTIEALEEFLERREAAEKAGK